MGNQDLIRSNSLNNVPHRKLQDALAQIDASEDELKIKNVKKIAINRYAESNIPIEYWTLKMERDFTGDPRLLAKYNEYIADIKNSYITGSSICFGGGHGLGKTMTITCILKKASQVGYTCLYTTLSDIVSVLTTGAGEDKYTARRELVNVDFLAIDEFDSRFMPNENAADLYARTFETIFRTRAANKLHTLMGTNSPNLTGSFTGPLKASLDSLVKGYIKEFAVYPGKDRRKEEKP